MKKKEGYTQKDIHLRSPQVEELMTKIPPSFIRWGITVILFIFVILFAVSVFVKYPETVNGIVKVKIDSASCHCYVFVEENKFEFIKTGQPVYIKFAAFPYEKYGTFDGVIQDLNLLEFCNNGYYIPIQINSQNKIENLLSDKVTEVNGTAEIIIEKTTLFHHIFR